MDFEKKYGKLLNQTEQQPSFIDLSNLNSHNCLKPVKALRALLFQDPFNQPFSSTQRCKTKQM